MPAKITPTRKPTRTPPQGWMRFQPAISHDAQVSDGRERTHQVKPSALASGTRSIICPSCEAGELRPSGHQNGVQCPVCGYAPSHGLLEALQQITTLPDALGSHACEECGYPEMRRLPGGVCHCPGCGSEVLPTRSKRCAQTVGTSGDHLQRSGGNPDAPPPGRHGPKSPIRDPNKQRRAREDLR